MTHKGSSGVGEESLDSGHLELLTPDLVVHQLLDNLADPQLPFCVCAHLFLIVFPTSPVSGVLVSKQLLVNASTSPTHPAHFS